MSFWWADTLGSMARLGLHGVNRQAILSNNYSLIDIDHHGIIGQGVHPDYYISYIWKQLIGDTVLAVDNPDINATGLRVYAHCTATATKTGAVAVIAININANRSVPIRTGLAGAYTVLTIMGGQLGLQADEIEVNGEAYSVGAGASATMPPLRGIAAAAGAALETPPHSISFLVFDLARAEACKPSIKSDDEAGDRFHLAKDLSGHQRSICTTDKGCSLNGHCELGTWSCRKGWKGGDCSVLNLGPAAIQDSWSSDHIYTHMQPVKSDDEAGEIKAEAPFTQANRREEKQNPPSVLRVRR